MMQPTDSGISQPGVKPMEHIEICCKEYETLRQEILTTMEVRNSVLNFGLATIGAVLTVSIALGGQSALLSGLIMVLIVPAISNFVLFIWLGEYQRMQRAGKFLMGVEKRINDTAGAVLLSWETHLRSQRSHMRYPYNTTVLMLTIISFMAVVVGAIILNAMIVSYVIIGAGLVIHIGIYQFAISKMAGMRA